MSHINQHNLELRHRKLLDDISESYLDSMPVHPELKREYEDYCAELMASLARQRTWDVN